MVPTTTVVLVPSAQTWRVRPSEPTLLLMPAPRPLAHAHAVVAVRVIDNVDVTMDP